MQLSVASLSHLQPLLDTSQLIRRECGQDALNALLTSAKKLVYLEAAPGYGKSCVMAQLYEQVSEQQSVAWCSLAVQHGDPRTLLRTVAQAAQQAMRGAGRAAEALLLSSDNIDVDIVLSMLINEMHTAQENVVMFFDSVEHAMHADVLGVLAYLFENTHQRIQFVLAGRASLPACFEYLRPIGQLCHIQQEEFRLSVLEASSFLSRRYGIVLPGEQVNALLAQIDAWPVALNLYCESVEPDRPFAPEVFKQSNFIRQCRVYFDEQVFAGLDEGRRQCLLELAQLNVVTVPLCDFLHAECESEIRDSLARNHFLFTVDSDRSYRFHSLFHGFLRERSSEIPPQRIAEIHAHAFEWSYEGGYYQEAIFHAIEIKNWPNVIRAIEFFRLEIMTHNQLRVAADWVAQIPEDIVRSRPKLLLLLSWSYALQGIRETALNYLNEIDAAGLASLRETEDHDVQQELDALNCAIVICRGRYDDLVEYCERYNYPQVAASDIFSKVQAAGLVYALFNTGRHDEAHRVAVKAGAEGDQLNLIALVYRRVFRGMAYCLDGRLRHAKTEYEQATSIAEAMAGDPLVRFSVSDALLAEIYYEWGEVGDAKRFLPLHATLERDSLTVEPIIAAYLTSARIAADEGRLEEALDILAQGESYGCRERYDRVVASMLGERVALLLRQNNVKAATAVVAELGKLAERRVLRGNTAFVWSDIEYHHGVSVALLEQWQGDSSYSLSQLTGLAEQAKQAGRVVELVKITMLEAVSYEQSGKHKTALRKAAQAIGLASEGLLLRSFSNLGDRAVVVLCKTLKLWGSLRDTVTWSGDMDYISRLKFVFSVPEVEVFEQVGDREAIEPLSSKDTILLRYLGEGLKNREIAQAMSLSENTIAWHLKNLYGKLHVRNRTSAVNIARQLRLV